MPTFCTLPREIGFREYAPCDCVDFREPLFAAWESFREALTKRWLRLTFDGNESNVVASHFVGLVPFRCDADECPIGGEHLILIKPKGDRDEGFGGLLRFLDLALFCPPKKSDQDYAIRRGDEKYVVVLAGPYAEVLRDLCRRDFRRYYRPEEGELIGRVKGRLQIAGHLRNTFRGRGHLVPCRWEEFTADNWDNRILLGAVRVLERAARDIDSEQGAAAIRALFRPVEPWFAEVEEVPIHLSDLARARLGRVSVHYREALRWAKLILRGVSQPDCGGTASGLVLDANLAFEKLAEVTAQSAEALVGGDLHAHFQNDTAFWPLHEGGSSLRPDIVFRGGGQVRVVGDAKYKDVIELAEQNVVRLDDPSSYAANISTADWNQLYVYLRLAGAAKGFFVVPYWNNNNALAAQLLVPPQFTRSPLDGENAVEIKVLALNLLSPLGLVRREGARLLAEWFGHTRDA
jgi:hypothetical protein